MGRLDGKAVLITGAARGLGASTARIMAREGATVVLADVLDREGEAMATKVGYSGRYLHLDVTSEAEWEHVVGRVVTDLGRLDVLVNNAGTVTISPLVSTSLEEWHRVTSVNQTGVFLGMKAALPTMTAAGGGAIVNVASIEGLRGSPQLATYAASKHAVVGLTRAVALEAAHSGVRVNCVCPGVMKTPMLEGVTSGEDGADGRDTGGVIEAAISRIPFGRLAAPDEIGRVIAFVACEEASYLTGASIPVDGGMTAGGP